MILLLSERKLLFFPLPFDGDAFHVRKLKAGVVLEHTL